MCAYAQTQNTLLLIVSVLYLSLVTLGCISVSFSKSDSENVQWAGWIPYISSLIISSTVVYFTYQSSIGLWYLGVSLFWHGVTLSNNKNNK
tara:strand:- start:2539 stop:2811 length:273 start_codon:yes stop_codon:yes gene_type:complete